jgi:hypothetical protein
MELFFESILSHSGNVLACSLKHDFVNTNVDWSEWRETPAGEQAKGDPTGVLFAELS